MIPVPFCRLDGGPPSSRRQRVAAGLWRAAGRAADYALHLRRVRLSAPDGRAWRGGHPTARRIEAFAWRAHRHALALLALVLDGGGGE